jgi:hypothetical protein
MDDCVGSYDPAYAPAGAERETGSKRGVGCREPVRSVASRWRRPRAGCRGSLLTAFESTLHVDDQHAHLGGDLAVASRVRIRVVAAAIASLRILVSIPIVRTCEKL